MNKKLKHHGEKAYHKVNELARHAHSHRLIIKDHKHRPFLAFPLSLGIALTIILPFLALTGLAAYLINDWRAEIERIEKQETP